jgi:N-acyl amino acid synthase of PEP-CTERM/exosortase system
MHDSAYSVILADTKFSRNIHFGLRYQVYCREKGYEDPERFKDERERDLYDARATHFLLRSQAADEWIGASRIILGSPTSLPAFRLAEQAGIPWCGGDSEAAEFSRLAIPHGFQRSSRRGFPAEDCLRPQEAAARLICAGLNYARERGARHLYFLSQRSMIRLLDRIGVVAHKISPAISHRGIRYLYRVNIQEMYRPGSSAHALAGTEDARLYRRYSAWSVPRVLAA